MQARGADLLERSRRFDRLLQGDLPLPLARLYARAHHAKGERERHDHAFHLVETTLKLGATALVGRYRTCGVRSERVDAVLRHLALPSLGQWRDIFRETLRFLRDRKDADSWSRAIGAGVGEAGRIEGLEGIFEILARATGYRGRKPRALSLLDVLELLPTYRNAMSDAHGSIKADVAWYTEGTPALLALVRLFVKDADGLAGGRLVFAEEVRYVRAEERQVVWVDLTGPTAIRRHPPEGGPPGLDIRPGQLYLEVSTDDCLPLYPLLHYRPGEMLDQVYYLNRARGGKSGIQFLSYETGDFYLPGRDPDGDRLVGDLEQLLSWITSTEVDSEAMARLMAQSRSEAALRPEEEPEGAGKERRSIGDFEILGELGRGGMAIVYLARQRSLDRKVALKVLPMALKDDPTAVARFKQEVRALARCDHPNVVKVLSSGQADGTWYYAMEYVDGTDLGSIERALEHYRSSGTRVLREGHFSLAATTEGQTGELDASSGMPRVERVEKETFPRLEGGRDISFRLARVIRDCARGVQHIHDHGIIHRDIKPQNIMITRETQQPVVMDLGLAKMTGVSQSLTLERGSVLGTLRYMAPEQLQRNLLELDARADVYSLGSVLYELACQRPLFDGDTEHRLTKQIIFESPVAPQKANPRIPADLATIIDKATRKDPRERYKTAAELADDLERFIHGEAITAKPPTVAYLLKLYVQRHRAVLATIAAVSVLLVGAFLGISRYRAAAEFERSLESGRQQWKSYLDLKEDIAGLEASWREARARHESWEPVWERRDEIEAWHRYAGAREQVDYLYNGALLAFHRARRVKGAGRSRVSVAERAMEEAFWERYREADRKGGVTLSPGFFELMIRSLPDPAHAEDLEGRGMVALLSDPPGAEVYCFRYEQSEAHLVPLPFDPAAGLDDPATGLLGEPFLEVESVEAENAACPFWRGDRLLAAQGQALSTRGDLARALEDLAPDEQIEVRILRDGQATTLRWTPFPAARYVPATAGEERTAPSPLAPGRLVRIREQLGFTLAGYPLEFLPECLLGVTRPGSPLRVELPRGSYLLVVRKPGYRDTRFPVATPIQTEVSETVRLLEEDAVPPGFLYVPTGTFPCGGDPEAWQSLSFRMARVEGFLAAREEVTLTKYLEFLNDPATVARVDPKTGRLKGKPLADWSKLPREILPDDAREQEVRVVPASTRGLLLSWDEESRRWAPVGSRLYPETPVFGISLLAGLEYAHWLTRRYEGRWRFRLPTDLEWERAGRGVDRRIYVWGNYPVWSFCRSNRGRHAREQPIIVGVHPVDESVFGLRDVAGSVSEMTTDKTLPNYRFTSLRGGNYYTVDDPFFRLANRNGRPPESSGIDTGLRLVADPPTPLGK